MFKSLPSEVEPVIRDFRVCEFSTVAKNGTPITWPLVTLYQPHNSRFLLTTSIGFPNKAFNIRRNSHVSLLFSDPTGSGLENPPSVLIQGNATVQSNVVTEVDGLEKYWRDKIFRRQPASEMMSSNFLARMFMDWYYMRLLIFVTPIVLFWWPQSNFSRHAQKIEVEHVE